MLRSETTSEIVTAIAMLIFALGWMDFGQGPDLTWWKVIQLLGN